MRIIDDLIEPIRAGKLSQPFSAGDLPHALMDKFWSLGSYGTVLTRSSGGSGKAPPLFVRVSRGRYRLAAQAATTQTKRRPSRRRSQAARSSGKSR